MNWVNDYLTRNSEKIGKIHSRAYNSITFNLGSNIYQTECLGGPIHYFDREWKPIDTKLVAIGSEYGAPGLKTRIGIDGSVRIIDDAVSTIHSQISTRVGALNITNKKFSTINNIPTGIVSGDSIIREVDNFIHKLILTETGLREELIVLHLITGNSKDFACIETDFGRNQLWPDGWINNVFSKGGYIFPMSYGMDAVGKIIPMKRYAIYSGGSQYIYTGIIIGELQKYTFPVIFDPDFGGDSANGWIAGQHSSYSIARSTSTDYGFNSSVTNHQIGQQGDMEDGLNKVWRSYLRFDTSGIPDDAFIQQVNLKMVCIGDYSISHDFDVNIIKQDWSEWAGEPSNATKRETAYDGCLSSPEDDNIWRNTSGISSNTQYASGNLSTSWVNKAGYTWYSLASNRDYDGSGIPPGYAEEEWIGLASYACTTPSYRPILTVLYEESYIPRYGFINHANPGIV